MEEHEIYRALKEVFAREFQVPDSVPKTACSKTLAWILWN